MTDLIVTLYAYLMTGVVVVFLIMGAWLIGCGFYDWMKSR